jgi:hypothetical protein
MFNILGALSSMEREIIVECTRGGLTAAAARGRHGVGLRHWTNPKSGQRRLCWGLATCRQSKWHSSFYVRPAPCIGICGVVAPLLPRAHDGGSMSVCILVGVPQSLVGRKHL